MNENPMQDALTTVVGEILERMEISQQISINKTATRRHRHRASGAYDSYEDVIYLLQESGLIHEVLATTYYDPHTLQSTRTTQPKENDNE